MILALDRGRVTSFVRFSIFTTVQKCFENRMFLMAFSRGPFWALKKTDRVTFRENPFQCALKCRPTFSSVQSRTIPLGRNSLKLGAKITIWIHFSTTGSRAGDKKQIKIRNFLQQVETDDVVFSLEMFGSSEILLHWSSKIIILFQILRRSKWDFQESSSELGHFSERSKKSTWKRHNIEFQNRNLGFPIKKVSNVWYSNGSTTFIFREICLPPVFYIDL
jgi:hypothetical protein